MSTFLRLSVAGLVLALVAVTGASVAQAQVSVSLFPVSFRYDIPRGSSQTGVITVSNPSTEALSMQVEVENFTGGDGGTVEYAPDGAKFGLLSWITIDRSPFELGPGQKREMSFTINVPDNAEVGGHYGAVLFRANAVTGDSQSSAIGVSGRVGSIILVSVPGAAKKSGELISLSAPKFLEYGPLPVTALYKNTGSVHYVTKGEVTYTGIFGRKKVPFEEKTILPDVERTTVSTLDKTWLIGPIFMSARLEAGDGSTQTDSAFTFAFPIIPGLVTLAVLALGIFGSRYVKKKFKLVRVDSR